MKLNLLALLVWLASSHASFSQTRILQSEQWTFVNENQFTGKQSNRRIIPEKYKTVRLNLNSMKTLLQQAPMWQTEATEKTEVTLTLPMPDGSFQEFIVAESPVMHPELAKKFPTIKSYSGTGVDDPTAYLRFDLTPQGFHAMVLTGMGSDVFIDPYSTDNLEDYVVYYKSDFHKTTDWQCAFADVNKETFTIDPGNIEKAGDCKFRTYSLALSCTGEYATFHGGTAASVLAAMTTTMTRVNGIFEKDLSVTLQMVANNNLLIYLNAATDPFTNTSGSTMLSENQTTCDNLMGNANYDIGHVFSTGGGGVAYIKAVCNAAVKAGGVTGSSSPVGDAFDIDYVAHEMGHQFGANHTQNNNCNRNAATSVEVGSGSTIMSYAGVCAPNVQAHSDAYFHAISLSEIAAHVTSAAGNGCATSVTNNTAPVANAGADYVIPKSTPFVLTGTGTDANDPSSQLTYCWEQMDNAIGTMPPLSTALGGPVFRSMSPTTSNKRFFPNLTAILNNTTPTWEVLPATGRALNFRMTVRDNRTGGGCTHEDNMFVTVDAVSGPFLVTVPNTAVSFTGGLAQTITWSVAGTTAAPVNCANVDILLSLDGGQTFPITLASATPNDGTENLVIPNNPSTQARVMVKGAGNIFFDISNVNFTITQGTAASVGVTTTSTNVSCNGGNNGSATAIATGGNGSFTYGWSNGGTTATISNLVAGTYIVTVTSAAVSSTASAMVTQPAPLTVSVAGVNATGSNNGSATATPSGGTPAYNYSWNNGSTAQSIGALGAGTYTVMVTDAKGCSTTGNVTITATTPPPSGLKFQYGVLTNVTNTFQTVTLQNTYTSMVVVATVVMPSTSTTAVVTRIQNATGNSFQIKVQPAKYNVPSLAPMTVHYMVAEEGTYTQAANGVKFEAKKFVSTKTSKSTLWQYEARTYAQGYTNPVVLAQVMTANDANWSAAFACKNGSLINPATNASLSIGKMIAEDNVNVTRANETIGYMVFETGTGTINGKKFAAATGSDIVKGTSNAATGYAYTLTGFTTVEAAVLTSSAIDGSEGAWAVLATGAPLTTTSLKTWVCEDDILDTERSHTTEQIAYIVFGTGTTPLTGGDPNENNAAGRAAPANYLAAYPNPARSEVTVEFNQNDFGGPTVTLQDVYGNVHFQQTLIFDEPGVRVHKIDLQGMRSGQYILHVFDGKSHRTAKLVIVEGGR